MPHIYIERFCESPMGTFGRVILDDFQCYSVERQWLGNTPNLSCIPVGTYDIIRVPNLKKKGAQWQFVDVPDRSAIEFHVANVASEVQGCIGLGKSLGTLWGQWAVMESADTLLLFNKLLDLYTKAHVTIDWRIP